MPINHCAYQPLCLLRIITSISYLICFGDFKAFSDCWFYLIHPISRPEELQLAGVSLSLVICRNVKLVSVDVEDGSGEVGVGRELALEVVQRPTVEKVAAATLGAVHPLVEHGGVAEGVGAAVVQAPGQGQHLRLVEEGSPHVDAVLRPDDGVGLHLEMSLAMVIHIVIMDARGVASGEGDD